MNSNQIRAGLVGVAAALAMGSGASAGIQTVSGNTTWLPLPPAACGLGQLAGQNAYAWDEQQGVSLNLAVDMTNNPGTSASPIPGNISGVYDSHFLHFEPVPGVIGAAGTVTFWNPIVAVIFGNTTLDVSDAPAGAGGTAYPTLCPLRGVVNSSLNNFSINGNVLSYHFAAMVPTQFVDQVRVITQTPAPGSVALVGAGALVATRRRRKAGA